MQLHQTELGSLFR